MAIEFDFSGIEKAIDRATAALDALDKRLQTTAKNSTIFNRAFGSTANFDKFVDSINKLNTAGTNNFKVVSEGLIELANAVKQIPPKSNLGSLVRDLTDLTATLNDLKTTKTSTTRVNTYLESLLQTLELVTTRLNAIKLSGDPAKALEALARVFKSVDSISKSTPKSVGGTNPAIDFIKGFIDELLVVSQFAANSQNVLRPISKTLTTLATIIKTTSDISGKVNVPDATKIGDYIFDLFTSIDEATRKVTGVHNIQILTTSLNQLQRGLTSLTSGGLSSLNAPVSGGILGKIKGIFGGNTTAGFKAQLKNAKDFGKLFGEVARTMSDAAASVQNLQGLSTLGRSFQGISAFINAFTSIDLSKFQSSAFSRLPVVGKVFRSIGNVFKPSEFRLVADQLKQFSDVFKYVKFPDNFGSVFTGLGRFLNSINKLDLSSAKSSAFSRIPIFGAVFRAIGTIFAPSKFKQAAKAIKDFSTVAKDIKFPTDIGAALSGIGDFIRSLNRVSLADVKTPLAARIPILGKIFTSIQSVFAPNKFQQVSRALKSVTGVFKGLKGVDLAGFGSALKSITDLAINAEGVKFDKGLLNGFDGFTKELAKGLNNLSGVKVKGSSLGEIGTALSGIANISPKVSAIVNKESVSSGDILEAAAGNFIAAVAFSVLSKVQAFVGRLLNFSGIIKDALRSIGQSLTSFGNTIENAGQSLLRNFGLAGLANNPITKIASDFDHLSNAVQTFGHLTNDELKQAQAFSDEIGRKYPLSANDALQATLDLIKAGQNLSSTQFILPNAADLAALGDTDIPNTTKALIQATNTFDFFAKGVSGDYKNIASAANSFSGAADISTATVNELIEGLSNVGPAANGAGLNLQDTLAILAQFNDAGLRGAEAGTQLSQVLRTIHTDKALDELAAIQKLLKDSGSNINLSLSNADGSLRNFNEVIESLSAAYKTLNFTQSDLLDSISKIAGAKSSQGLSILIGNKGFGGVIDAMNSMDTASERAIQLLNDFQGDVEQFQGSLETLEKNGFLPLIHNAFRPFVQLGRQIVDGLLTLPDQFFELAGNILFAASSLATFVGGVAIAIGVIAKLEGVLFTLTSGFIGLVTNIPALIVGLGGFVATIGTIIVAVTALAGIIGGIALVFSGFRDVIERNIGGAGGAFDQFRTSVEYTVNRVGAALGQVGRVISLIFGGTAQKQVDGFGKRVADFFNRLTIGSFKLDQVVEQIGALFENFGNFIEAGFGGKTPAQLAFFENQLTKLSKFPLIRALFGNNINSTGLRRIFGDVTKFVSRLRDSVEDVLSGGIGALFGEPGAIEKAKKGIGDLLSILSGLLEKVTGLDLTQSILDFDQGKIGAGVTEFFKTVLGKIREWFVANRDKIISAVGDVLSFGTQAAFGAGAFVLRILGLDSAADAVQNIGDTISDIIHDAVKFAIRLFAGETVIDTSGVTRFIQAFLGDPQNASEELANRLATLISDAIGKIPALLTDIGTRLNIPALVDLGNSLGTSDVFQHIADALGNIGSYPLEIIGNVFSAIQAVLEAATEGNTSGVIGVLAALATVAASSGALSVIFTGLKSILFGAVLPAVGIITLVSALGNLKQLLQDGDVGKFLTNTLADIASTVLSFFGVDMSRETILSNVTVALKTLSEELPAVIQSLAGKVVTALEEFRAKADQALGPLASGFGTKFFNLQKELGTTNTLGANVFNDIQNSGLDEAAINALVQTNKDAIIAAFGNAVDNSPDVNRIPEALFANIAKTLSDAGIAEEALSTIDAGPVRDAFTNKIKDAINNASSIPVTIKIDPTLDLGSANHSIFELLQSGQITTQQASQLQRDLISRQNVPGRANGGDLKPYSAYQVHDTSSPELAQFGNGLSLLLTGKNSGRIAKIVSMAGAPVQTTLSNIQAARNQVKQDKKAESPAAQKALEKALRNIQENIAEAELNFFQAESKLRREANDAELKATKQLEHDRANIISEGRESVLDAIRRGDGASALAASKAAHKQLNEQAYQFQVAKEERADALKQSLSDQAEERKQRLAQFAQDIQDAQTQHDEEAAQQAEADAEALDEADQTATDILNTQKVANTKIKKDTKDTSKTVTDAYYDNNQALIGSANAFSTFVSRIQSYLTNLAVPVVAYNSNTGAPVPVLPSSSGNPTDTGASHPLPPGHPPSNPSILTNYRDPYSQLWIWNGRYWQSASSTSGRAQGGSFSANSAFRVHDTDKTEIMTMSNGQSLVLSGKNSGRVMPVQNASGNVRAAGAGGDTYLTVEFNGDIISQASDPLAVAQETRNIIMPEIKELVRKARTGQTSRSMIDVGNR